MPIKCESCKFLKRGFAIQVCTSARTRLVDGYDTIIGKAREICDREGDGIFVYFEPKDPTTGAAFAGTAGVSPAPPTTDEFERLLREPGIGKRLAAAGGLS